MSRRSVLSADQIVATAVELIDREPPGGLSMRKLGSALGVDPMAIYHHVPNRETLVVLALERVLSDEMPDLDPDSVWEGQVRVWALAYRAVVLRHRTLTYEALRDPQAVERVATDATRPLVDAIAASGMSKRRASRLADLVVDYVHGHTLALTIANERSQRRTFNAAIDTIIRGVRPETGQSTVE